MKYKMKIYGLLNSAAISNYAGVSFYRKSKMCVFLLYNFK